MRWVQESHVASYRRHFHLRNSRHLRVSQEDMAKTVVLDIRVTSPFYSTASPAPRRSSVNTPQWISDLFLGMVSEETCWEILVVTPEIFFGEENNELYKV